MIISRNVVLSIDVSQECERSMHIQVNDAKSSQGTIMYNGEQLSVVYDAYKCQWMTEAVQRQLHAVSFLWGK